MDAIYSLVIGAVVGVIGMQLPGLRRHRWTRVAAVPPAVVAAAFGALTAAAAAVSWRTL